MRSHRYLVSLRTWRNVVDFFLAAVVVVVARKSWHPWWTLSYAAVVVSRRPWWTLHVEALVVAEEAPALPA